ncbi:unnamed protein product [Didymodactylos carnosus]|uniref:Uncharacterized protein n=1 Tax=Didymodactylos carnosus TaxID=1234261 RepID=A0A815PRJ3_9BILA|nr:unnamed protein product [Didymodactylos carnosus]CAF4325093.1 unnamed protein product [Didymodactylos carnosus]
MVYSFLIFQKIRIIMNEIYDTSRLPPNILTYSNDNFYDFVQEFLGDVESDIVKIQCLKNARLLLHTPNVFSLFDLDCADLLELKKRACFILKNNSYVVRPGIIYNIEYLINIFKYRMNQQVNNNINHLDKYTTSTIHQALTALTNNVPKTMSKEPFLHLFLQNILNNYGKSKNKYEYNECSLRFTSSLFILAGKNTYEFLRINLPGSLPSMSTAEKYNKNHNTRVKECEFRFDSLTLHLNSINSGYVYISEDCSGIISKVCYDNETNSFIGFSSPLHNAAPYINYFQTDDFYQLQQWFKEVDKSTLINIHMVEPIISTTRLTSITKSRPFCFPLMEPIINVLDLLDQNHSAQATYCYLNLLNSIIQAYVHKTTTVSKRLYYGWMSVFLCRFWWAWIQLNKFGNTNLLKKINKQKYFITKVTYFSIELNIHCFTFIVLLVLDQQLPRHALNIYLFSSQSCESIFRNARALTGTFSFITNFSVKQFIKKAEKISILNSIKSQEELNNDNNDYSIRFPIHQKNRNFDELNPSKFSDDDINELTIGKIEIIIFNAYNDIKLLIHKLKMSKLIEQNNIKDTKELSLYEEEEESDYEEDDKYDSVNDESSTESLSDENEETDDENDYLKKITTAKEEFRGMRIYDKIKESNKKSYFCVDIDGKRKYLHKQTACWLLTNNTNQLPSDRLLRVQLTGKQK